MSSQQNKSKEAQLRLWSWSCSAAGIRKDMKAIWDTRPSRRTGWIWYDQHRLKRLSSATVRTFHLILLCHWNQRCGGADFELSHLFVLTEDLQFTYEKECITCILMFTKHRLIASLLQLRQKRGSLLLLGLLVTCVCQEPKRALSCWLQSGSRFHCKMCMLIATEHLPSLKWCERLGGKWGRSSKMRFSKWKVTWLTLMSNDDM